jgi:RTX calcium-binding nonapeptide repeat (4 copies)
MYVGMDGASRAKARLAIVLGAIGACLAVLATTSAPGAEAKSIKGTQEADKLVGTKKSDKINGRGGKDRIKGGKGADKLKGGGGKDKLNAVDRAKDKLVNGGAGKDVCRVDRADRGAVRSCEKVKVVGAGGNAGGGGGNGGGGNGGGGGGTGLVLGSSSGLSCAAGALPLCPFTLQGEGADAPAGTVTGGGGVTVAAGGAVTVTDGDWSAGGTYACESNGFLRVSIGAETIDVPVTCTGA